MADCCLCGKESHSLHSDIGWLCPDCSKEITPLYNSWYSRQWLKPFELRGIPSFVEEYSANLRKLRRVKNDKEAS